MRKGYLAFCTLILFAMVQPLWGGTVYVPLAADIVTNGNRISTEIRLHNDAAGSSSIRYLFLPGQQDGTSYDRETDSVTFVMAGHSTRQLENSIPANARGLLEISADEEVAVTARLVGRLPDGTETFGVDVPVVSSRSAVTPGRTSILSGLDRNSGKTISDLYLLNLSIKRSQCAVEVYKRGGLLVTEQTLSVPALSLFRFSDFLGLLAVASHSDATVAVTCDELSHPFATVHNLETAELRYVTPAGDGTSALDPFPSNSCPDDAILKLDGTVHVPVAGNERGTFFAATTPGEVFSKLILTMEFTHGGWHQRASDNHNVFWLNRTATWRSNLFGYFNLFGPNRNFAKIASNVTLPGGAIQAKQAGALFQEGLTYAVRYTYDTGANFIELVVNVKGGEEVVRIVDQTTVNKIVAADRFMVAFGHTSFEEGPEVPSRGWQYANICLRLE